MGSAGSKPADYESEARGITVMLIVLTTVAIASRLTARYFQPVRTGSDDYAVVLGYLLNLGLLITILLVAKYGGFSLPRMAKLSKAEAATLKNTTYALGFMYTFAIIVIKISVLSMYHRVFTFNERWFRIGWWANFVLIFPCYTVTSITLTAWQVANSEKFGANNISKYASYALGSVNAISDVLVLVLPVIMISRLHLPSRERAAVMGIFLLGLIATSISIMRVARFRIKRDHHWNAAYSFYNDSMTSAAETSVALICVCLIVIKPLLRKTRDVAAWGVASLVSLISQGSSGRRSQRSKTSGVSSIRSARGTIRSRKQGNSGAVQEYDVEALPGKPSSSKPSSSNDEIALVEMRPWEGK
ncbi:hypothetical protein EJ04DRAFT_516464 [Polyplosphaeria fusca]|uniref:Rhodopsin domain-containing protein n=1 Tax=Polyplosphaeria fusca TaxID=682080 RepID=A0A9P4UX62_9PLEO|nr:hypothetical protein EJ04DRAFT_516464 [Polyplosphaeria fusca]